VKHTQKDNLQKQKGNDEDKKVRSNDGNERTPLKSSGPMRSKKRTQGETKEK